jgi:putative two-component system response regulator
MRVLLIEDDADIRMLVEMVLTNAGHDVTSVGDGTSGLGEVFALHPDLVLLDVRMPGMNGLDVCRRIREHADFDDVRVVILTAHGDRETTTAVEAGADGLLGKPFSMKELLAVVGSAANGERTTSGPRS